MWTYFSPAARRAAATASYDRTARGLLRDRRGCCPLGVALRVDAGGSSRAPTPARVSARLGGGGGRADPIAIDAMRFTADWDGGVIDPADLGRLLEVTT